jgi:hypothetical protein
MMVGANGNAVAWKFAMQNQFGWRDRQQLSGDPDSPLRSEVQLNTNKVDFSHLTLEEKLEIRDKLFPNVCLKNKV